MLNGIRHSLKILTLASILFAVGIGCSTKKRQTVSKVDPETYVAKSDFEGKTFHLVRGIEEADSNNTVNASPGFSQDYGLVTVRITENELQFLSAFDPQGRQATATIVASYPIKSHFDIVRDSNDYGESTNKIIEDKSKPWKQRSLMRVGWERPSVTYSKFTLQLGDSRLSEEGLVLLEDVKKDEKGNISWLVESNVRGTDAFRINRHETLGGAEATPGFRVTYRTFLMPVKPSDFKPVHYSLKDFARFGYFTTQLNFEDPYKGLTDSSVKTYAEVHNICEPGRNSSCSTNKIVWFVNKGFPKKYLPATKRAVEEWNRAFQVALGRQDRVIELDLSREVELSDPTVNVIALYPHKAGGGLLGVAQGVVDPRTGEKISVRSTMYEDGIRSVSASVDTLIDLITAQDPLKQVIGTDLFASQSSITSPYSVANVRNQSKANEKVLGLDQKKAHAFEAPASIARRMTETVSQATARKREFFSSGKAAGVLAMPEISALAEVTRSPLATLPGFTTAKGDEALAGMDRLMLAGDVLRAEKKIFMRQAEHGVHNSDMVEEAAYRFLIGKVKELGIEAAANQRERLKEEIEIFTFYTTLLHEMGHNFGLRHNFQASADRKHYQPQYHQLLKRIQAGDKSANPSDLDRHMYSSVMDYGADFYSSGEGLGAYDRAAIRYAYNRSIDRERDPQTTQKNFYFCTDHQVNETALCRRFDKGGNVSEITKNTIEAYHRNWALAHFRRGRANYDEVANGYLGRTLSRTMIPVRQVMDELFWMQIIGEEAETSDANQCSSIFMRDSIAAGEIVNVCDPREAVRSDVDPDNVSTWARGLRSDKVGWNLYRAYGLADLVHANEIAKNFFAEVLGASQPGTYVFVPGNPGRGFPVANEEAVIPTLRNVARTVYGLSQDSDVEKFVESNKQNFAAIGMGRGVKPFFISTSNEAGVRRLNALGSVIDKVGAIIALSLRDLGVAKYSDLKLESSKVQLLGNPYAYPYTKDFAAGVFERLITANPMISAMSISLPSGPLQGRALPFILPAALSTDLQTNATVAAFTDFVFAHDQSILSKLRICSIEDQGCLTKLSGQSLVRYTSADGDNEYRAAQIPSGDSIAYKLISVAKDYDDFRKAKEGDLTKLESGRTQGLAQLKTPETAALRVRINQNLARVPELEQLRRIVGTSGDQSAWSQLLGVTEQINTLSPRALKAYTDPLVEEFNEGVRRIDGLLSAKAQDETRRQALLELRADLSSIATTFAKISSSNFDQRRTKAEMDNATAQLGRIDPIISSIYKIMKATGN